MKRSSRNYLIGVLILTLVTVISIGCATKKETTQPDTKPAPAEVKTEEPAKSVPAPAAKTQEATPAPSAKTPEVTPPPSSPATTTTPPPSPPPSKTVEASQPPAPRTTEIVLPFVNLRQAPSTDSKVITVVKKGTKLTVLEEKLGWLRVRLEDGAEGWVGKNMTAEGTKPSPAAPAKPKSP
jgi:type IV secretory pathway VirB10-like protein